MKNIKINAKFNTIILNLNKFKIIIKPVEFNSSVEDLKNHINQFAKLINMMNTSIEELIKRYPSRVSFERLKSGDEILLIRK